MHLNETPIFREFLIKIIDDEKIENFNFNIDDELSIEMICKCGDELCSTVYLKRDRAWDDENQTIICRLYEDQRGLVIFHFTPNGKLEIEALDALFPYKAELEEKFSLRI